MESSRPCAKRTIQSNVTPYFGDAATGTFENTWYDPGAATRASGHRVVADDRPVVVDDPQVHRRLLVDDAPPEPDSAGSALPRRLGQRIARRAGRSRRPQPAGCGAPTGRRVDRAAPCPLGDSRLADGTAVARQRRSPAPAAGPVPVRPVRRVRSRRGRTRARARAGRAGPPRAGGPGRPAPEGSTDKTTLLGKPARTRKGAIRSASRPPAPARGPGPACRRRSQTATTRRRRLELTDRLTHSSRPHAGQRIYDHGAGRTNGRWTEGTAS